MSLIVNTLLIPKFEKTFCEVGNTWFGTVQENDNAIVKCETIELSLRCFPGTEYFIIAEGMSNLERRSG